MEMQTICFCAGSDDNGRTVLSVLKHEMHISASMISRLKREPYGIMLNGERVYVTHTLRQGDVLHAAFPAECTASEDRNNASQGFDILYEDKYYLIINKPAGLSVQPVQDPDEITLEKYLIEYLHCVSRPHPVSRLDKGTSGLMTVAKNAYAHELLKRQMHTDGYYKEYRAILAGCPASAEGEINAPIGFFEGSTYARCVREDGAPSVSRYEILKSGGDTSYAKLIPVTGRTHQLRVHMAYLGYPLLGDWLYGERSPYIERPALHSYYLRLKHPITGVLLEIICPPPADFEKILNS